MQEENITAYKLNNPKEGYPKSRSHFYNEQIELHQKGMKPFEAVGIVQILLFDLNGEIFVQKRSKEKRHNPSLLDKSIGGHISFGDSPEYTAMVETVQELQVPSIITKNPNDFVKTLLLLKNYLNNLAILTPVKDCFGKVVILDKYFGSDTVQVANNTFLFFGVYTGAVKTVDKEAKGIIQYSLEDLKDEMQKMPQAFTPDLVYFINYYSQQISEFIALLKNN
jgi:isopentenyldiphosphate isomerase